MDIVKYIAENIEHGDLSKISNATGYSITAVRNYTKGFTKKKNYLINKAALLIIKERKEQERECEKLCPR